jgi:hypothetical protein
MLALHALTTMLAENTYTLGVIVCQEPKWERAGGDKRHAQTEVCATSGAEGDYGHKAAGLGTLFAVGEEETGVAGGAEVDGVNVLGA